MKKLVITSILILSVIHMQAQDFKTVLYKAVTTFDTTKDQNIQIEQGNKLALIAKKWDTAWIAHYYLAWSRARLSFDEKDATKRDAYLDDADKERDDAVKIAGKESDETYVLAALIANARLSVNPSSRWMKYGKLFNDAIESAKELNPDNPRMY